MNQTLLIGQQLLCTHVKDHVIKILATRKSLHGLSYILRQSQGRSNVYLFHRVASAAAGELELESDGLPCIST